MMMLFYRNCILPSDREAVGRMVRSTGFFNPVEEHIAVELVDAHLSHGIQSGYHFLFCQDEEGSALGYTCFGPITGTRSSFDLYWIVVDKPYQGHGVGRQLLDQTEDSISAMAGTRVYAETSSQTLYEPTRAFYQHSGYQEEACLKDFYAPGDSKIIYVKALS
jgi:ribosomal protein S18 acetylase RimI-like enzyme